METELPPWAKLILSSSRKVVDVSESFIVEQKAEAFV